MNEFRNFGFVFVLLVSSAGLVFGNEVAVETSAESAVAESAEDVRPLLIGAEIPEVTLKTAQGNEINLKETVAERPVVVIFYRGGWCPYCNMQLGQLQSIEADLLDLGYQLLGISPDRPDKLSESLKKKDLSYTLLSDSGMAAAKAFGIAFRVADATLEQYEQHDIDLEEAAGEKHHLLPVPSVFIIGTDARIKFTYVNPDYKTRLAPDVLLEAAKAALEQAPDEE
ncbi:MAG: peroxiredoxin-like family protein [Verrucomicrobiota bacterium]